MTHCRKRWRWRELDLDAQEEFDDATCVYRRGIDGRIPNRVDRSAACSVQSTQITNRVAECECTRERRVVLGRAGACADRGVDETGRDDEKRRRGAAETRVDEERRADASASHASHSSLPCQNMRPSDAGPGPCVAAVMTRLLYKHDERVWGGRSAPISRGLIRQGEE